MRSLNVKMASDEEDEDLEALRLAVLASMKVKAGSNVPSSKPVIEDDPELTALRTAALKTNYLVSDSDSSKTSPHHGSPVPPDFGKPQVYHKYGKKHSYRGRGRGRGRGQSNVPQSNLIVIQTLPMEGEEIPLPLGDRPRKVPEFKLIRPQDKWASSGGGSDSDRTQAKQKSTDKFSRFESSGSESEDSLSDMSDSEDEKKSKHLHIGSDSDSGSKSDESDSISNKSRKAGSESDSGEAKKDSDSRSATSRSRASSRSRSLSSRSRSNSQTSHKSSILDSDSENEPDKKASSAGTKLIDNEEQPLKTELPNSPTTDSPPAKVLEEPNDTVTKVLSHGRLDHSPPREVHSPPREVICQGAQYQNCVIEKKPDLATRLRNISNEHPPKDFKHYPREHRSSSRDNILPQQYRNVVRDRRRLSTDRRSLSRERESRSVDKLRSHSTEKRSSSHDKILPRQYRDTSRDRKNVVRDRRSYSRERRSRSREKRSSSHDKLLPRQYRDTSRDRKKIVSDRRSYSRERSRSRERRGTHSKLRRSCSRERRSRSVEHRRFYSKESRSLSRERYRDLSRRRRSRSHEHRSPPPQHRKDDRDRKQHSTVMSKGGNVPELLTSKEPTGPKKVVHTNEKLEARRRKFASSSEVKVDGKTKISLKDIVKRSKKKKKESVKRDSSPPKKTVKQQTAKIKMKEKLSRVKESEENRKKERMKPIKSSRNEKNTNGEEKQKVTNKSNENEDNDSCDTNNETKSFNSFSDAESESDSDTNPWRMTHTGKTDTKPGKVLFERGSMDIETERRIRVRKEREEKREKNEKERAVRAREERNKMQEVRTHQVRRPVSERIGKKSSQTTKPDVVKRSSSVSSDSNGSPSPVRRSTISIIKTDNKQISPERSRKSAPDHTVRQRQSNLIWNRDTSSSPNRASNPPSDKVETKSPDRLQNSPPHKGGKARSPSKFQRKVVNAEEDARVIINKHDKKRAVNDARNLLQNLKRKTDSDSDVSKSQSQRGRVSPTINITFNKEFEVDKQSRMPVHRRLGLPVHSKDSDDDYLPIAKSSHRREKKSHRRVVRELTDNTTENIDRKPVRKTELKIEKAVENVPHKRTSSNEDGVTSVTAKNKRIKIVRTGASLSARVGKDAEENKDGATEDELDARIRTIQKRNAAILKRKQEIDKDKQRYGSLS